MNNYINERVLAEVSAIVIFWRLDTKIKIKEKNEKLK